MDSTSELCTIWLAKSFTQNYVVFGFNSLEEVKGSHFCLILLHDKYIRVGKRKLSAIWSFRHNEILSTPKSSIRENFIRRG